MYKRFEETFTKEDIGMVNTHMKRWSTSLVITEMWIKTMRDHCAPISMAKIRIAHIIPSVGYGATRILTHCENINGKTSLETGNFL